LDFIGQVVLDRIIIGDVNGLLILEATMVMVVIMDGIRHIGLKAIIYTGMQPI